MDKDNFITPVIFRKEGKKDDVNILAVFPEQPGTYDSYTCGCYSHVGQHSSMDTMYLYKTKPAKPSEYADLKAELESIGYNLKVYKRWQYSFNKARERELANYK
ncbi:MAG: hypothetical protein WC516_08165 [Patescibacteria group bacterium]|jgi:hypothetical protein